MRTLLLVIGLAYIGLPIQADARPRRKIALAPIQGDRKNQLAQAIIAALGTKDFAVVGPRVVGRERAKLGLPDELGPDDARALATALGAAATIEGSVASAGGKRRLHLDVHPRGKPSSGFTIEFRTAASDGFRRGVHDEILKKLDAAADPLPTDPPVLARTTPSPADPPVLARTTPPPADAPVLARATPPPADRPLVANDAAQRARADRPLAADAAQLPPDRPRLAGAPQTADDNPAAAVQRPATRDPDAATVPLVRVDAGASFAQRQLSYETRTGFAQRPPRVLTTAGAGRVDGEFYPFALADTGPALARLGVAAAYDMTFGLTVQIPDQPVRVPIRQCHYAIGARYRLVGDAASLTFGIDYARREAIADRSGLTTIVLDTPDVDYAAITPSAAVQVPLTSSIAAFGGVAGMVLLDTGAIQAPDNYGTGTVYGLEASAGIGVTFARRIALRVAFEFSLIHLAFETGGALATNRDNDPTTRDVNGAADRSIGGVATLGLAY